MWIFQRLNPTPFFSIIYGLKVEMTSRVSEPFSCWLKTSCPAIIKTAPMISVRVMLWPRRRKRGKVIRRDPTITLLNHISPSGFSLESILEER